MSLLRKKETHDAQPDYTRLILDCAMSMTQYVSRRLSGEDDRRLVISHSFKAVLQIVEEAWHRGGDPVIAGVMNLMHQSLSAFGWELEVTGENDKDVQGLLHRWADDVLNQDWAVNITPGYGALRAMFYRELLTSGLVVPILTWQKKRIDGESYILPVRANIPNAFYLGVKSGGKVGDSEYYLARKPIAENEDTVNLSAADDFNVADYERLLQGDAASFSVHSYLDTGWHQLYPRPYLAKTGALMLYKWKDAVRQMDYRTTMGMIAMLLMVTVGAGRLGEEIRKNVPGYPRQADIDAVSTALKSALEQTGLLVVPGDVEAKHVHPDLQALVTQEKYAEIDQDLFFCLGLFDLRGRTARRNELAFSPAGLLISLDAMQEVEKEWFTKRLWREIVKRNKDKALFKQPPRVYLVPKLSKAYLTEEAKRLVDRAYDRGLVSGRTYVDALLPMTYDVELDRRRQEKESGEEKVLTPRIQFRQDVVRSREAESAMVEEAVLGNLPEAGKQLWEEVYRKYKEDGYSEERAAQAAWAAVKKIYKKVGEKWVKRDAD